MNTVAEVLHLFAGPKHTVPYLNSTVETAIFKSELIDSVNVTTLGIEHDEQADTKHHGGPDKALCVYLNESYRYWKKYDQYEISNGSFGENLILSQVKEDEVCIGDTYKIGELVVQVSQPRQPCFKLAVRNGWKEMTVISRNSGYTGFYLRVLEEGTLVPHAQVELVSRIEPRISIKEANTLLYSPDASIERLTTLINVKELAEAFRKDLIKKLNKIQK